MVNTLTLSLRNMQGQELIDATTLSSYIRSKDVSVDDETINGAYNLIFNERRLKAKVNLINTNPAFADTIKQVLLGAERLRDFAARGNVENYSALVFDKEFARDALSNVFMWGPAWTDETQLQTYSSDNLGYGFFFPKSKVMVETIFSILMNASYKTNNPENEFSLTGSGGSYLMYDISGTHFKHNKPKYTVRFKEQEYDEENEEVIPAVDETFWCGLYNLMEFLARGLEIYYSEDVTPNNFCDDTHIQYGLLMEAYMDEILDGLGTEFSQFISDNWSGDITTYCKLLMPVPARNELVPIINNHKNWSMLFRGLKYKTMPSGQTNSVCYSILPLRILDLYLCEKSEDAETNESETMQIFSSDGTAKCYYHLFSDSWQLRLAAFLSSIIQAAWYKSEIDRFVSNSYDRTFLSSNPSYSNSMLWHQSRHTVYGTKDFNYGAHCVGDIFVDTFFRSRYNRMTENVLRQTTIPCLKHITQSDPLENVYFGKVQVKTNYETEPETETEYIAHPTNPYPDTSVFQPVRREYTLVGETLNMVTQLYLDNIDLRDMSVDYINTFMLAPCMFENQNWLYFQNIVIKEYGCDYSNPADVYYDPIPVFDVLNSALYDGTFVYKDHFNTFFTSKPSTLINVMAILTLNGQRIYSGLVDRATIIYNKKEISFGATDIIGLITENIKAIDGCIGWAQYSPSANNYNAIPYCGTTLHGFMKFIMQNPVYETFLNITTTTFNRNKILDDISTDSAFSLAIQVLMKLVRINHVSDTLEFLDIDQDLTAYEIPTANILTADSTVVDNYLEKYNSDNLKSLAGFDSLIPIVTRFYNRLFTNDNETINLELYEHGISVNILDKIIVNGSNYIVLSKNYDFKRKTMSLNGVKVQ